LVSNSQYKAKIEPVWFINAGIEAIMLRKPRIKLANLPMFTQMKIAVLPAHLVYVPIWF
jgi:hypothetical protein